MASKSKATKRKSSPVKRSAPAKVDSTTEGIVEWLKTLPVVKEPKPHSVKPRRRGRGSRGRVVKEPKPHSVKPLTPAELKKLFPKLHSPARAEESARRQREAAAEFARWKKRQAETDRRLFYVKRIKRTKQDAEDALSALQDWAMRPHNLEDYATAQLAKVIEGALAGMTEIAESTSPAAARAREVLEKLKRKSKQPEAKQAKRRQRDRTRGGKSPQARSKMLGDMVKSAIADMTMAHKQGEREFGGETLPAWSFGIAPATDPAAKPVVEAWMKAVEPVVVDRLNKAGIFASSKWFDGQRGRVRRHVRNEWSAEVERARKEHVDWVAQGMVT